MQTIDTIMCMSRRNLISCKTKRTDINFKLVSTSDEAKTTWISVLHYTRFMTQKSSLINHKSTNLQVNEHTSTVITCCFKTLFENSLIFFPFYIRRVSYDPNTTTKILIKKIITSQGKLIYIHITFLIFNINNVTQLKFPIGRFFNHCACVSNEIEGHIH